MRVVGLVTSHDSLFCDSLLADEALHMSTWHKCWLIVPDSPGTSSSHILASHPTTIGDLCLPIPDFHTWHTESNRHAIVIDCCLVSDREDVQAFVCLNAKGTYPNATTVPPCVESISALQPAHCVTPSGRFGVPSDGDPVPECVWLTI
jgi:hypothetical protein